MTWAIQWEFLFSTGPGFCSNFYLDLWSNTCWKTFSFFLWLEGRWNQHLLKGFFSCQGKKPQLSQSQLWLWIIKYSTDTAAGNNGAAGQERLQRPQEEEDLTVQRFSFYKRGLSLQLVRQGQGWRGAIQPSFALRAALNRSPVGTQALLPSYLRVQ